MTDFVNGQVLTAAQLNAAFDGKVDNIEFQKIANDTDPDKGAAMVGFDGGTVSEYFRTKASHVVDSFSQLRGLSKFVYTRAFVSGTVAGNYHCDLADTTSPDDGWFCIVAADGGRWKRLGVIFQDSTTGTDVYTQHIARQTSHTGGTPGFTNSALRIDHTVGAGVTNYEWSFLAVLNNSATAGENVAVYGQGNRMTAATGPTWASVFEAQEKVPINNPTTGLVGIEVDVRANGTDSNLNRIGIDIVAARYNTSGAPMEMGYGVRIQCNGDNSNVTVGTLFGTSLGLVANVGLDLSAATIAQAAVKLAQNQSIAFDSAAGQQFSFDGSGLIYKNSGVGKVRLNGDGTLALNGLATVISGAPNNSGSVTPTLTGQAKPGVSNAIATWFSVEINGGQYWLPLWNN